jgi:hypothetical protein
MTQPKKARCTTPDCGKPAERRGKCNNHYQRLKNAVRAGKFTWEELEAIGEVLPAARKHRGDDYIERVLAKVAAAREAVQ